MASERLHKILAHAGVASRRACEEIIAAGRVSIDGQVVTELGTKADSATQDIRLDGRRIQMEKPEYWLLNKPKGVVCTNFDPSGRTRPIDLMQPYSRARLFAVGRLDTESKGLLIMTNDGEFANLLTHPRYEVPKTYLATVHGRVTGDDVYRLIRGVYMSEGRTRPVHVEVLKRGHSRSLMEITIRESRSRQIRRMLAQLRHPVRDLVRTRVGHIVLRGIGPGRARPLDPHEVEYLRRLATQPAEDQRPAAQEGEPRGERLPPRQRPPMQEEHAGLEGTPSERRPTRRQRFKGHGRPERKAGFKKREGPPRGERPPTREGFVARDRGPRPGSVESGERPPRQGGLPRRGGFQKREGFPKREGGPRKEGFQRREGGSGGERPPKREGLHGRDRGPRRGGFEGRSRPPRTGGFQKREGFQGRDGGPRREGPPREGGFPRREGPPREGGFQKREGFQRREGGPRKEGFQKREGFQGRDRGPRREGPPREGGFPKREGSPRREGGPRKEGFQKREGPPVRDRGPRREGYQGGGRGPKQDRFKGRDRGPRRESRPPRTDEGTGPTPEAPTPFGPYRRKGKPRGYGPPHDDNAR